MLNDLDIHAFPFHYFQSHVSHFFDLLFLIPFLCLADIAYLEREYTGIWFPSFLFIAALKKDYQGFFLSAGGSTGSLSL